MRNLLGVGFCLFCVMSCLFSNSYRNIVISCTKPRPCHINHHKQMQQLKRDKIEQHEHQNAKLDSILDCKANDNKSQINRKCCACLHLSTTVQRESMPFSAMSAFDVSFVCGECANFRSFLFVCLSFANSLELGHCFYMIQNV